MGQVVWLKSAKKQELADLQRCINTVIRKEMEENAGGKIYRAFVTRTRLLGYCRLLIFDASYEEGAEYFGLRFDGQGVCDYQSFANADQKEIQQFLSKEAYEEIHYGQAMALLGDALMQNYLSKKHLDIVGELQSTHSMRASAYQLAWQDQEEPCYYLQGIAERTLVRCYLLAVTRNDAPLVYDMLSVSLKQREGSRTLYCYHWNHELQDCRIIRMRDLPKEEGTDIWKVHLLFRSPADKVLESVVYFHLVREKGGWRIGRVQIGLPRELKKDSPINPINDLVFVSVIEDNVNDIVALLKTQSNIEETLNGDGYPKLYKWFRSLPVGMEIDDVSALYTVQIMVLADQVILYSSHLAGVNQAIEFLLGALNRPLLFTAQGMDTLENIYYTTVVKRARYQRTAEACGHYSFSGELGQRVLKYCYSHFEARWQYYASGSSFCDKIEKGWVEVYACRNEVSVHFYNITAEEVLAQESWAKYHPLATICLQEGKRVQTVIRTRNMYYPYMEDPRDFLLKNLLEFGRQGSQKIKLM